MRGARICHVIWAVSAAHGAPARRRKTHREDVLRPREFSPADAERAVTGKLWLDELTSKYVFQSRPEPPGMQAGEAFLVPHSNLDPAQIKPDRLRFERRLGAGGVNNVYSVSYHANWAAGGFDPEKAAQCMRLLPAAKRKSRNAHVIGGELFLRITEGRPIHKKPTQATHIIRIWRERWVLLHCGSGNIYYFKDAGAAIGVGVESVGWADLPKGGDAKGNLALAGSSRPAIRQYDNVHGTRRAHAIEFTEAADGDKPARVCAHPGPRLSGGGTRALLLLGGLSPARPGPRTIAALSAPAPPLRRFATSLSPTTKTCRSSRRSSTRPGSRARARTSGWRINGARARRTR